MNFSFLIKAIIISFFVFLIVYAANFVSVQKNTLDSNNYTIKDTTKESINVGWYRMTGEITFDEEQIIKSTISNYLSNNNLEIDNVSFDIAIDNDEKIVTVRIYTDKNILNAKSEIDYTFSYQVIGR